MTISVKPFLEMLFPDLTDSFIEVRCFPEPKTANVMTGAPKFYETVDALIDEVRLEHNKPSRAWFFGVCPRSEKGNGTKTSIRTVRTLWADLDGKDYSGGKPEALDRLRKFEITPSAIVDSGNGYHAYWLLDDYVSMLLDADAATQMVETANRTLATCLGADMASCDLARVLRLPNTSNWKNGTPLRATILKLDPDVKYPLSRFQELKPVQPVVHTRSYTALREEFISEGSRESTLVSLAGLLWRKGFSSTALTGALKGVNETACKPPLAPEDIERIAGSVSRYTREEPAAPRMRMLGA